MGYASNHQIKAVCFDIDGTFYPKWKMDVRLVRASLFHLPFALKYNKMRKAIRKEDGYNDLPPMSYDEISKRGAMFFYGNDDIKSQKKYRDNEKSILHDSYIKSYATIKSARGVKEALDGLRSAGYRMAALSDFPIGVKLKAMGLEEYFEKVISSEDLGHFKPSRTPFKALIDSLKLKPEEILYVGDSYSKDVLGSKKAGMHTCLIFSDGVKQYKEADICASSWADFIAKVL